RGTRVGQGLVRAREAASVRVWQITSGGGRAIWEATPAACPGAVLAGRTLASVGEQLGNLEDLARVAHARDTPRLTDSSLAVGIAPHHAPRGHERRAVGPLPSGRGRDKVGGR